MFIEFFCIQFPVASCKSSYAAIYKIIITCYVNKNIKLCILIHCNSYVRSITIAAAASLNIL